MRLTRLPFQRLVAVTSAVATLTGGIVAVSAAPAMAATEEVHVKQNDAITFVASGKSGVDCSPGRHAKVSWIEFEPNSCRIKIHPDGGVDRGNHRISYTETDPSRGYKHQSVSKQLNIVVLPGTIDKEKYDPRTPSVIHINRGQTKTVPLEILDSARHTTSVKPDYLIVEHSEYNGRTSPAFVTTTDNSKRMVVRIPGNQAYGDYTVYYQIHYKDHSWEESQFVVSVDHHTDYAHDNNPVYSRKKVQDGQRVNSPVKGVDVSKVRSFVFGTIPSDYPDGLSVDKRTGTVTFNPHIGTKAGHKRYRVPVIVNYKDETRDTAYAEFDVVGEYAPHFKELHYPPGLATVGSTSRKTLELLGKSAPDQHYDGPDDQKIVGAKPAFGSPLPSWVKLDSRTGTLTYTSPPSNQLSGEYGIFEYGIFVEVDFIDASSQVVKATIRVVNPEPTQKYADKYTPKYSVPTSITEGSTVTIPAPSGVSHVKKYFADLGSPKWARVNRDGSVTLTKVPAGNNLVTVNVLYTDGSHETVHLNIGAKAKPTEYNKHYQPQYSALTATEGDSPTIARPGGVSHVKSYKLSSGAPSWAHMNSDGSIKLTRVPVGTHRVPVTVMYTDNTVDTTSIKVTVKPKPKPKPKPRPTTSTPKPRPTTSTSRPAPKPRPTTSTSKPAPRPTTLSPKPAPSTVTVTRPAPKPTSTPSTPTQRDADRFTPRVPNADAGHPADVRTGGSTTVTVDGLPAGSTLTPSVSWATGGRGTTVTVSPGDTVSAGRHEVPVTVIYPDGSRGVVTIVVDVMPRESTGGGIDTDHGSDDTDFGDTDNNQPGVGGTDTVGPTIVPGEDGEVDFGDPDAHAVTPQTDVTHIVPGTTVDTTIGGLPAGSTCVANNAPEWVTVGPDCSLSVNPPMGTVAGSTPVVITVTQPDGSTRIVTIPVGVAGENQIQQPGGNGSSNESGSSTVAVPLLIVLGVLGGLVAAATAPGNPLHLPPLPHLQW